MAVFIALLALVTIATHAAAQESHGTIAVVRYDLNRIIIAADSRHNLGMGVGASQNDTACKIAALGKHLVFVASGLTGYDNAGPRDRMDTWRATEDARRVYDWIVRERGEWHDKYLYEFAKCWGEVVQSRIAYLFRF